MSTLSDSYSRYMKNNNTFLERSDKLTASFSSILELINDNKFINCGITDQIANYPKYPNLFPFISNTGDYNIWKIHNVSLDTTQFLTDYITNTDVLKYKLDLDKIPSELVTIKNDINLQYSYFTDMQDLYKIETQFYPFKNLENIINFNNCLFDDTYDDAHIDYSFIHLFLFDIMFRQQIPTTYDFSNKLNLYSLENKIFDNTDISNCFTDFVTDNSSEILTTISNIILQGLYQFTNISDKTNIMVEKELAATIPELKQCFVDFMEDQTDPMSDIIYYTTNLLYVCSGSNLVNRCFSEPDIINLNFTQQLSMQEDSLLNEYLNNISNNNIKSYLYVSYLYKTQPVKFLNSLLLLAPKYARDIIKPDYNLVYPKYQLQSLFETILSDSNCNYTNLVNFLNNTLTLDYLKEQTINNDVINFGSKLFFIKIFDNFFNSDRFEDYVNNILEKIYILLRKHGHVDNTFNWCNCHILVNVYLKTLFRSKIMDGELFQNLISDFGVVYNSVLNNDTGEDKYTITKNLNESQVKVFYKNFVSLQMDKLHNFIESMYLSTITQQVTYSNLSYFIIE